MFFFANVTLIYNEKYVLFLKAIDLKLTYFMFLLSYGLSTNLVLYSLFWRTSLENIAISVSRESVSINIV